MIIDVPTREEALAWAAKIAAACRCAQEVREIMFDPLSDRHHRRAVALAALAAACGGSRDAAPIVTTAPPSGSAVAPSVRSASRDVRNGFELVVPVAPSPVPVADRRELRYELHLTNFSDEPLTVSRVRIFDQSDRAVVELAGESLDRQFGRQFGRQLGRPGSRAAARDARTVAPGARAILYVELACDARALHHRVEYTTAGNDAAPRSVDGAPVAVDRAPPVILGAPLRGGPWAAVHDPAWPRGHRRVVYTVAGTARIPGRYAIDWVALDAAGRYASDPDRVASWYGYGVDVLAVADAVVAAVRDDVPEVASVAAQTKHAIGDATGNYVALDLGHDRFAFYEHLKPGSLRVRVGQRVRRGEVLGALGFTGDSTGPHLHLHVADANAPLDAEGVPYVFTEFEELGAYPSMDQFGSSPWSPGAPARRHAAWPGPNTVVQFSD